MCNLEIITSPSMPTTAESLRNKLVASHTILANPQSTFIPLVIFDWGGAVRREFGPSLMWTAIVIAITSSNLLDTFLVKGARGGGKISFSYPVVPLGQGQTRCCCCIAAAAPPRLSVLDVGLLPLLLSLLLLMLPQTRGDVQL